MPASARPDLATPPGDSPEELRAYLHALTTPALGGVSQMEAARLLRIPAPSLRRWLTDGRSRRCPSWSDVELLRRLVRERA